MREARGKPNKNKKWLLEERHVSENKGKKEIRRKRQGNTQSWRDGGKSRSARFVEKRSGGALHVIFLLYENHRRKDTKIHTHKVTQTSKQRTQRKTCIHYMGCILEPQISQSWKDKTGRCNLSSAFRRASRETLSVEGTMSKRNKIGVCCWGCLGAEDVVMKAAQSEVAERGKKEWVLR